MKREKLKFVAEGNKKDIFQSIDTVCERITDLINKNKKDNIQLISLIFFVDAKKDQFYDVRDYIINKAKKSFTILPALSVIGQPPADGSNVLLEAEISSRIQPDKVISYAQINEEINLTKIETADADEYHIFGITVNNEKATFFEKVQRAFEILESTLVANELGMHNIVRQWNYVEDIVGFTSPEDGSKQNYQVLNNIRHDFYSKYEFSKGFPAATGIGMSSGGFVLDCIAIKEKTDLRITPVKNPAQVCAYDYSEKVLIGSEIEKSFPRLSPKFERAKFYKVSKHHCSLLISGTAAINNEESLAKDDAGKQTEITLDNISKLIESASELLKIQGEQVDHYTYPYLRVYIKFPQDFKVVEQICKDQVIKIDPVYLIGDICRKELLVEIEGVVSIKTK